MYRLGTLGPLLDRRKIGPFVRKHGVRADGLSGVGQDRIEPAIQRIAGRPDSEQPRRRRPRGDARCCRPGLRSGRPCHPASAAHHLLQLDGSRLAAPIPCRRARPRCLQGSLGQPSRRAHDKTRRRHGRPSVRRRQHGQPVLPRSPRARVVSSYHPGHPPGPCPAVRRRPSRPGPRHRRARGRPH